MHPRALIRRQVQALLLAHAGLAALVGNKVFRSRVSPLPPGRLPCVLIYTDDEPASHKETAPRRYTRELALRVECLARLDEDLDDALDALAAQVEDCLLREELLDAEGVSDLMHDIELTNTELGFSDAGEQLCGSARLSWTITYETELPEPYPSELSDLRTVHTEFDLVDLGPESADLPDGTPEAVADISLPQD
ncbi:hypothetical protein [Desulfocurvibacter africanus]|uniref:hypothetical protein n=1 Tax=Desulfocurvibacter africanus TaxID=873 RepID=UPI0003FDA7C0|nr:hypothetical protein [Desulfocurvibacter africanus]